MIKAACHVPVIYKTPDWRKIGGELLKKNYDEYMGETTTKLLRGVHLFGLSCYDDGASLMKCPLTNFLVRCPYYIFIGLYNFMNFIYTLLERWLQAPSPYGCLWFHKALGSSAGEGCLISGNAHNAGDRKDWSTEGILWLVAFDGAANVQRQEKSSKQGFLRLR